MNDEIEIAGNKKAEIKSIAQRHTYSGLLEGLPTREMNARLMQNTVEEAKKLCYIQEVFLIEPEQTPISYTGNYPFGVPASLPKTTCMALLKYYGTFRDKDKDYCELGVVWFQEEYAFPITTEVLEKIKAVPFAEVCGEFNY